MSQTPPLERTTWETPLRFFEAEKFDSDSERDQSEPELATEDGSTRL